jgi:hypothetical protein
MLLNNTKGYILAVIFTILVFIGGYFTHPLINPNRGTLIDSVVTNVITIEDSIRISTQALIEAKATIAEYDITEDGTWVKRKQRIVYNPVTGKTDTMYISTVDTVKVITTQVAELDTSMQFVKDSVYTKNHLKLLFAYNVGALNFNYSSTLMETDMDSSYYKLKLGGTYIDGVWIINLNEDYNIKKKTIIKENTVYVHQTESFWDKFSLGPTVSVGYGVFNKQLDTFVGFGVMYNVR